MPEISRVSLFGKLNTLGYKAIESATVFCKLRGNPYVELVHWVHQLLQLQDSDLHRIIRHFDVNPGRLAADLTAALDRLPRGASSIADLSAHVESAVERGWVYATLMYGDSRVRTGHLILGLLKTPSLRRVLPAMSGEFSKVVPDTLAKEFSSIVDGSVEDGLNANDGSSLSSAAAPGTASGAMAPASMGKGEAIQKYCVDLTERAKNGEIDKIVGRDEEIRQIVDILMRRRQNNPILTGEAGVGKTAVVEGFARRIAEGDVPPSLKDVRLLSLDIGLLQAGASMKGEFENRLRQLIEEVQSSETPIILFIDEAHTLIGAGGAAGTGDAANLLKPALARGTLRTVAATTWAEYKKHIEKDPALTRRFQVVQVLEPDEPKALLMMRGIASMLESHHKVQILDSALEGSVRLSNRYIAGRQLPDKSVSLLDTACARVAVSQHATPAEVEDTTRILEALDVETAIIEREEAIGIDVNERRATVEARRKDAEARLEVLNGRWDEEKALVETILELRRKLRDGGANPDADAPEGEAKERRDSAADLEELRELQDKLAKLQGVTPLVLPSVDENAVASVVGDWTGIPVGRMVQDEVKTLLELDKIMAKRVIGQDHGLRMIAKRIQTSRAKLENPNKPIGVFMLAGPSGVGKTETALTLAETLYGGEQNVITINMSEYQEAHTVSTLKGAPPGYVGYGEGGILTEAVRRRPYSVVLLDEVEKAHSDVHEIFFQVFDKGWMEDGEGRIIDFKNTLILLTSNVGSDLIMNMCSDPEMMPSPEGIAKALRKPLLEKFPAALLGRIVTIPYYPLSEEMLGMITRLQLGRIVRRVEANHGCALVYDDAVVELIVARCTEAESGGRVIDAILTNTMLPTISTEILNRMLEDKELTSINIGVEDGEFSYNFG
jgi:type VI secretion system protein VasG